MFRIYVGEDQSVRCLVWLPFHVQRISDAAALTTAKGNVGLSSGLLKSSTNESSW